MSSVTRCRAPDGQASDLIARTILNFSPGRLRVLAGVKLENADLTVTLERLSFFLARGEGREQ